MYKQRPLDPNTRFEGACLFLQTRSEDDSCLQFCSLDNDFDKNNNFIEQIDVY